MLSKKGFHVLCQISCLKFVSHLNFVTRYFSIPFCIGSKETFQFDTDKPSPSLRTVQLHFRNDSKFILCKVLNFSMYVSIRSNFLNPFSRTRKLTGIEIRLLLLDSVTNNRIIFLHYMFSK